MISIIMIVYDVERYVEQSIKSVLAQTYKDFELILVVGHGNDRSEEICEEYAKKDERIKLIAKEAKGIADARNTGLCAAAGELIGFVDSDDHIEPLMFESMVKNMEKYDADIAICGRFYEYMNKTLADPVGPAKVMSASEALSITLGHDGFFLHCWDKLFKRKLFEGVTFRTDVTVEDRIVVDRLLSKAGRIVYDPTPMYHFRERSGSNSKRSGMIRKNIEADLLMEEFITSEHPELLEQCRKFMLYEYITAVQNEIVSDDTDKEDVGKYVGHIARLVKDPQFDPGKMLKVKAFLAMYLRPVLKAYTKRRQNRASALERFP